MPSVWKGRTMKGRALLIASLCLVLCSAIPCLKAQAEPVSFAPDLHPLTALFENLLSFLGLPSEQLSAPEANPLGEPENPPSLEGGYIIEPNG